MKRIKKFLGLLFVALIGVTLAACGGGGSSSSNGGSQEASDTSLQDIKDRGVLRVAVWDDLPPYSSINENGEYEGYAVDLSKRMAKDLLGDENKVEFIAVNAEERVDSLNSGRADIVMATFTKTDERAQVVDFADPYMKVAIGIAAPKSENIRTADDLKGKTVILNKGTTAEVLFTQKYPDVNLDKYESKHQQFQALLDGRGQALADDNSYLFPWVKENPDYEVAIKEFGEVQTNNPAVKKGNTSLLNWINDTYAKYREEGVFQELYDKDLAPYFGEGITAHDVLLDDQIKE